MDVQHATINFQGREPQGLVQTVALPLLAGRRWLTGVVVATPEQYSTHERIFDDPYAARVFVTIGPEDEQG